MARSDVNNGILEAVQGAFRTGNTEQLDGMLLELDLAMCDGCSGGLRSADEDGEDDEEDICASCNGITLEKMLKDVDDAVYCYVTDFDADGYPYTEEGLASTLAEIKEYLSVKTDAHDAALTDMLINAHDGGTLRVYFTDSVSAWITDEISTTATHITFYGTVHIGVVNGSCGGGHVIELDHEFTLPFNVKRLRFDALTSHNWTYDIRGHNSNTWCESTMYRLSKEEAKPTKFNTFSKLYVEVLNQLIVSVQNSCDDKMAHHEDADGWKPIPSDHFLICLSNIDMCVSVFSQFVEGVENNCLGDEIYGSEDTSRPLEDRVADIFTSSLPNLMYEKGDKTLYHKICLPSGGIEEVDFSVMYPIKSMDVVMTACAAAVPKQASLVMALYYCLHVHETYGVFMFPHNHSGSNDCHRTVKNITEEISQFFQQEYGSAEESEVLSKLKLRLIGKFGYIIRMIANDMQLWVGDEFKTCEFMTLMIEEGSKNVETGLYPLDGEFMTYPKVAESTD